MDNNQTNTNNQIVNDFLVTTQINTQNIDKSQMEKDLELLKEKEVIMQSKANTPIMIKRKKILPRTMNITDVDVLKLRNPFKGE